jgi:pilus assembly protein FimV
MRKRKPAAAAGGARGSIADQFGDSPYHEQHGGSSDVMEAEAASLRDQIANDPRNPGLYLELLSLYYAERDVVRFEETAAEMRAYIADPHQPEWQEAQAMGQELAPHNPLFSDGAAHDAYHDAHYAGNADTVERPVLDEDDFAFADHGLHAAAAPSAHESEFGFGLGNAPTPARAQPTVHVPPVPAPAEDTFSFDDLPPLESPKMAKPAVKPVAMESAPSMKETPNLDDDFFTGEDAIGTKLDLAKAYMDMGDPDGARSMLEEVVAEGNDAQKAEAHRLIVELR